MGRNPVRPRARLHLGDRDARKRRPHPIPVVLHDVDDRQLPHRRHVQRLEEDPLVDRRVAHEADADLVPAAVSDRPRKPRPQRNLAADDPVAAVESHGGVEQVHGTAAPTGTAVGTAVQLRHGRPRGHSLGDGHRVVTVGGEDQVIRAKRPDPAGGQSLLPDVQVAEAADLADRVRLFRLLLEAAVEEHVGEQAVQFLSGKAVEKVRDGGVPAFAGPGSFAVRYRGLRRLRHRLSLPLRRRACGRGRRGAGRGGPPPPPAPARPPPSPPGCFPVPPP